MSYRISTRHNSSSAYYQSRQNEMKPKPKEDDKVVECSYDELCGKCRYCNILQRLYSAGIFVSLDTRNAFQDVSSPYAHFAPSFRTELQNQILLAKSFDYSTLRRTGEKIDHKFVVNMSVMSAIDIFLSRMFGSRLDSRQMVEIYSMVRKHLSDTETMQELLRLVKSK